MWQRSLKESGKEHNWKGCVISLKQSLLVSYSKHFEILMFIKQSEAA